MAKVDSITELKDYKTWWTQILFWRTHLDVFLERVMKVKLKDTQKVVARACSEGTNIKVVKSRGYGKSWLIAWIAIAIAILYPDTPVAVVSATARQATIVMKKILSFTQTYPELLPQIRINGRDPVVITNDRGLCYFKNGSKIESYSLTSVVGERAKVLIIDEAPRISENDLKKNATPITNYTRDICLQNGYEDYESKIISITSACLKSNFFYSDFVSTLKEMRSGNKKAFACALDYRSAARVGITKPEFFEERKKELPESVFDTEYGSLFIGEESGSLFPYNLTSGVRKGANVEYEMPRHSKSYYVMSLDIATSERSGGDNSVLSVIKCTDKEDGRILKQLVYMKSYHGKKLNELADEVRKTYVRFPNTLKVVFDYNGLGDGFPLFFETPWVDPETMVEYSAWGMDDKKRPGSEPMLHPFRASGSLNQELVTALRVALEQKTLILPIESRDVDADESPIRKEEMAIYIEADALQVEMGNLVVKSATAGGVTYDTAKATQHKDRYSSLAMGVWYIAQLEAQNKKKIQDRSKGPACVGLVSYYA